MCQGERNPAPGGSGSGRSAGRKPAQGTGSSATSGSARDEGPWGAEGEGCCLPGFAGMDVWVPGTFPATNYAGVWVMLLGIFRRTI